MTIQWTLIASFLYCEIFLIVLLLLPFVPARLWQAVFRTRVFQFFAKRANVYFTVFIAVLAMFFFESVREMRKYSNEISSHEHTRVDSEMHLSLKLFRAQRNYYISGLALFLWLVIRKLVMLILTHANLQNSIEKIMREAQSATDQSEKLLKEQIDRINKENAENSENHAVELRLLQDKLAVVEEELEQARTAVREESP